MSHSGSISDGQFRCKRGILGYLAPSRRCNNLVTLFKNIPFIKWLNFENKFPYEVWKRQSENSKNAIVFRCAKFKTNKFLWAILSFLNCLYSKNDRFCSRLHLLMNSQFPNRSVLFTRNNETWISIAIQSNCANDCKHVFLFYIIMLTISHYWKNHN